LRLKGLKSRNSQNHFRFQDFEIVGFQCIEVFWNRGFKVSINQGFRFTRGFKVSKNQALKVSGCCRFLLIKVLKFLGIQVSRI
jgi:hypothetical protein